MKLWNDNTLVVEMMPSYLTIVDGKFRVTSVQCKLLDAGHTPLASIFTSPLEGDIR